MGGRGPQRPSYEELVAQHAETQARLAEVQAALAAVRAGAADAVVAGSAPDSELIALGDGDRFFSALVAAMQEGAASLDARGTVLYANGRLAELLARPLERVVGRALAELATDASAPSVERLVARAARAPARAALKLVAGDGRHVPVAVSAAPLQGERGELCLVVTDLTVQRRAESELGRAEARFGEAFEHAPNGMALVGLDGRLERVNRALCELAGRPPQELVGAPLASLLERPGPGPLPPRLEPLGAGERDRSTAEVRYVDAAGRVVWVSESAALIPGNDSRPAQILLQVEDVGERRLYEERLEYLANTDPVTGLPNRRSFEHALEEHAGRVARYGAEGALLVLDLDHFKYVNDTLGHATGDELLLLAGSALRGRLRETDTLARLGGDEFAVLLPRADRAATEVVAGELLGSLRELEAPGSRPVTASAGVALFAASEADSEEMLVRADLAMYEAKEAGRDRAVFSVKGEGPPSTRVGMGALARLERALAVGSLALDAQPMLDLDGGHVDRYELLVRIRNDGDPSVPAGEFVPLAERFGLVSQIDRWVLERAVDLLGNGGGAPDLRLAVNVSAKSLAEEGFVDFVVRRLAAAPAAASRLTFELTETAAVANLGTARHFAERLRDLGSELALDDFGAGFGSFTYIRHIPFDLLKIDGQFVKGCASDPRDRAIVEAVVQVASSLGKRTVAEFVGDTRTVEVLREVGVHLGQGYHLGHPEPVEAGLARGSNGAGSS